MMLLLLMNEADCLDHEHRRTANATSSDNGAGALTANTKGLPTFQQWCRSTKIELRLSI
jgi:hypothetical protein